MTRPTKAMLEDACLFRGRDEAQRYLAKLGYQASIHDCQSTIERMIRQGRRASLAGRELEEASIRQACSNMHDAMLRSYRAKADRLGCSVEEAMLSSLYAPHQVDAWKAAA